VDAKDKGYSKMTVRTKPGYFPHTQAAATSKKP
jgi:hypothetical protein